MLRSDTGKIWIYKYVYMKNVIFSKHVREGRQYYLVHYLWPNI